MKLLHDTLSRLGEDSLLWGGLEGCLWDLWLPGESILGVDLSSNLEGGGTLQKSSTDDVLVGIDLLVVEWMGGAGAAVVAVGVVARVGLVGVDLQVTFGDFDVLLSAILILAVCFEGL